MKKPSIADRIKPALQSLTGSRGRIAILLASIVAVPTCKMTLNEYANSAAAERDKIVGENGIRRIEMPEADASVVLETKEINDRPRVVGALHVSSLSPLRELSRVTREYELPEDAYPLTRLVIEASREELIEIIGLYGGESKKFFLPVIRPGRITLRTQNNKVALVFDCDGFTTGSAKPNDDPTCLGKEIDPRKLDAELLFAERRLEKEKERKARREHDETLKKEQADAGTDAGIADAGVDSGTDAGVVDGGTDAGTGSDAGVADGGTDAGTDAGTANKPTTFPRVFLGNPKIHELFEEALEAKIPDDFDYLKSLGRQLAVGEYDLAMENLIRDIEQNNKTMKDIIKPITFLLGKNPNKIQDIADHLGVTLPHGLLKTEKPLSPELADIINNSTLAQKDKDFLKEFAPNLNYLGAEDRKKIALKLAGSQGNSAVTSAIQKYDQASSLKRIKMLDTFLVAPIVSLLTSNHRMIPETSQDVSAVVKRNLKTEADAKPVKVDKNALIKMINEIRAEKNVPPVTWGACAEQMATYWAKYPQAVYGGHKAGGIDLGDRARKYSCSGTVMENIDWPGSFESEYMLSRWYYSPDHYKNMILKDIRKIAVSCVSGTAESAGNFCVMNGTGN